MSSRLKRLSILQTFLNVTTIFGVIGTSAAILTNDESNALKLGAATGISIAVNNVITNIAVDEKIDSALNNKEV